MRRLVARLTSQEFCIRLPEANSPNWPGQDRPHLAEEIRSSGFNRVLANATGQVAFFTFYNEPGGAFTGDAGIRRYESTGSFTELARIGQPSPSGKGDLSVFGAGVSLNNSGAFGFIATFTDPGSMVNNTGMFHADGVSPLAEISLEGQPSPDGDGNFTRPGNPALNDRGDTAFVSGLTGESAAGVFVRDLDGITAAVIRQGQPAPDGNGEFVFFANVGIDESGKVAFIASLDGTSGAPADELGIFIGDGSSPPVQVVRGGQPAPDGNGTITVISTRSPVINEAGQTATLVGLAGTTGGTNDDIAILRSSSAGGLVQLVRKGEAAPDGNGKITPSEPAINSKGQIAFLGSVSGASGGAGDGPRAVLLR